MCKGFSDDLIAGQEDEQGHGQGNQVLHLVEAVGKGLGAPFGKLDPHEDRGGRDYIGEGVDGIGHQADTAGEHGEDIFDQREGRIKDDGEEGCLFASLKAHWVIVRSLTPAWWICWNVAPCVT